MEITHIDIVQTLDKLRGETDSALRIIRQLDSIKNAGRKRIDLINCETGNIMAFDLEVEKHKRLAAKRLFIWPGRGRL